MIEIGKCLIRLTPSALIVANTGQPFSRLGVISICASHIGTKKKSPPVDSFKDYRDIDLPKAIREREIETYLRDENRLIADSNQEIEVSFDYGGRFLWELLQNADDAMSPLHTSSADLIGIKGLGFKSVLEISRKPTIYSNPFHFYFSADESIKILTKKGVINPPPMTFRIPHDGSNIEDIIDLVDEYPTIISLPFIDMKTFYKVEEEIEKLDIFFLLLCQHIKCVEVELTNGQNRQWRIEKENDCEIVDGDISVEEFKNGKLEKTHRFRRWTNIWSSEGRNKRNSVAICLPLNENRIVKSWQRTFPLFSFFPTEELLPFECLLHASFELDQSRKHVRNPINKDILDQIGSLLARVLNEVPADISLESFIPKIHPNQEKLSGILWELFKAVLIQTEFVPCINGKLVVPSNAKIWENDLGKVLRLDCKELNSNFLVERWFLKNNMCKALYDLGATDFDKIKYLNILKFCINDDLESCKKTLVVLYKTLRDIKSFPHNLNNFYLNICREIPCWMTKRGISRSLNGTIPLLRKNPEMNIPDWLSFDVLDDEFLLQLEQLESEDSDEPLNIWSRVLSDKLLENRYDQLLHNLLVPTINKEKKSDWWESHGKEALNIYESWTKNLNFKGNQISIWNDIKREKIGGSLFLPTDKGWMPSCMCYAGEAWGTFEYFDVFFKKIKERGIIEGPDNWPVKINENRNHWENILRFAGVSWGMKLVRQKPSDSNEWSISLKNENAWSIVCPFGNTINESDWNDYLASLKPPPFNKKTQFDWNSKASEQWGIEFFPEALPQKPVDKVKAIMPIAEEAMNKKMKYLFQKGGGVLGMNEGQIKSFAAWQILDYPWIPCKPGLLDDRPFVQPNRAYMPKKSIGGLLPEIRVSIADSQDGRDMATFLTQVLMVREVFPPNNDLLWKEWMVRLPKSAMESENQDAAIMATRMLYGEFFKIHNEKPKWFEEISEIPGLMMTQNGKNELLTFKEAPDLYWIDEPYLAVPKTRNEILSRFNIFIMEQEQGNKAKDWLEIKPLSKIIQVEPRYYSKDLELTKNILKIYRERFDHLKVASDQSNIPKPEDLKILAVYDLRVRIQKEGELISAPNVSFWNENGLFLIEGSRSWEALGLALANKQSQKNLSNLFENLLRAKTIDEVFQRLRDQGISESAFDYLKNDFEEAFANYNIAPSEHRKSEVKTMHDDPDKIERQNEAGNKINISEQHQFGADIDVSIKEKPSNKSGMSSQSRREKGKNAEDWMRAKISELMSITDWTVSGKPEKDQYGRESDIVLSHTVFGKYHIEVKHVEAGYIFWSELEVAKAKENIHKYCIVIMQPDYMKNEKNIFWLWNPLHDLMNRPKQGKWLWKTEADDPRELDYEWNIPLPRKTTEATNFSFVIKVDDIFLEHFEHDSYRGLIRIKQKLEDLAQITGNFFSS